MATKVHMEALSPTMEEGQIVKWLKSEGDAISNGELLAEIETDKATMELVARGEGILRKIFLGEGSTAPVGEVIAVIAAEDEDISEFGSSEGSATPAKDEGAPKKDADQEEEGEGDAGAAEADAPEEAEREGADEEEPAKSKSVDAPKSAGDDRIKASPLARRLAADEGIELEVIEGSGPGGRIVKRDVEKAAKEGVAAPAARASAPDAEADYEDIRLSQMRKTIAKRLVESIGPVPHFFLTVDVDMTRAVEARKTINKMIEKQGIRISFNDIVLKSVAMALRKHPECNAHWRGDHIRQFNRVHLGVAVAVPDGLITPVVRDAHLKGMAEISAEIRELAGRAREKKLKPDEYTGSTFSVSNLGMFGIEEFTGVINPPEAAILAVGALEDRPVAVDGEVQVRTRMKVTMSCDHRVIDGAQGSGFLRTLKSILEEPLTALV